MSRYEWEEGEVKLPANAWAGFKRELRAAHDRLQEKACALALLVYEEAIRAGKRKRGFDFYSEAERIFSKKVEPPPLRAWHRTATNPNQELEHYRWTILQALFPQGERGRPRKPRKAFFPKATTKTTAFAGEGWSIKLDDKGRTFFWRVSENNHACEDAHDNPLAATAFRLLDKVKWTRDTGGKIVGNDEYNEENRSEGGGANYAKRRYGPRGQDHELAALLRLSKRRTRAKGARAGAVR